MSNSDKNEILYYNKSITLIQLVARSEETEEKDGKGFIVVNDDSGFLKLGILFSEGSYTREMFEIVNG